MARKIYVKHTEYTLIDSVYDGEEKGQQMQYPLLIEEQKTRKIWRLAIGFGVLAVFLWIVGSMGDAKAQQIPGARYNGNQPPVCATEDIKCREQVRKQWGRDGFERPVDPGLSTVCNYYAPARSTTCTTTGGGRPPRTVTCQQVGISTLCN